MLRCSSSAISSLDAGPSGARAQRHQHAALGGRQRRRDGRRRRPRSACLALARVVEAHARARRRGRTSRWRSGRRPCTRSSLTYVPLVERPSSSTVQMPSIALDRGVACATPGASHGQRAARTAGARPIVSSVRVQRQQPLHAVAVAQLEERRAPALRLRAAPAARRPCSRAVRASACTCRHSKTRPNGARGLESVPYGRRPPAAARALARLRRPLARRAPDDVQGQEFQEAADAQRPGYALALSAAVANYERLLELQPDHDGHDADARRGGARPARRRGVVGAELSCASRPRAALAAARERPRRDGRRRGRAAARRAAADGVDLRARLARGRATRATPRPASAGPWPTRCCAGTSSKAGRLAPDERALPPPRLDGGQGDRPAHRLPVDVPRGGRHEPEGGPRRRAQVRRGARAELPWSGGLAAGTPRRVLRGRPGSRKIARYFNLGDDSVPDRSVHFDGWRRWMHQHGPVAVLLAARRASSRTPARCSTASTRRRCPAATPPRCSATAPTTSCCARAGARAGATAATPA